MRHHSGWLARLIVPLVSCVFFTLCSAAKAAERHLLYVAEPGIRDDLSYGGHGVLVFDIDHGHQFVRRIPTAGLNAQGKPSNVKGICASAATGRLYVSTLEALTCIDLQTDKLLWERAYEGGCDRMSISPDGKTIYLPSLEGKFWRVIDAGNGDVRSQITTDSGAHNTIFAPDGQRVYLAGLKSPVLTVASVEHTGNVTTVGPFSASIRPFTVNGSGTLCFVCIDDLLGFEIGDLRNGKKLHRVEVSGFHTGSTLRHGCPSHGIGLTPDEKELWVTDAHNKRLHVFDNTVMPPKRLESVALRDEPGWVTFSIDGRHTYPSTGDVIDTKSRKVITTLKDEAGHEVQSEKLMEIDFNEDKPVATGDQFGIGRVLAPAN